ncbi:MAG: hypothetical protein CMF52_06465 [Legionellales bacterium]|nr:hypothetical protein [Legionellales bacterium]|tara:strand:- start:447 stop:1343 length:897 start_codon:yes stop_codon:yes gene_type:complete
MSRNSRKLNRKPQPKYNPNSQNPPGPPPAPPPQAPTVPTNNNNPFGLSFVTPTEDVLLPSGGKFYPKSNPFHGLSKVEIKHMTAREEDLLSTLSENNEQNIFNTLIDGILTNKNLKAENLLEQDKLAILLRARATGYGEVYAASAYCENCKKSTKFEFNLSKTEIVEPETEFLFDEETNCFTLELPVSKINVKIRNINDSDLKSINEEKAKKKELGIDFNLTISKLSRMIIIANDIDDRSMISKLVEVLPAADAKVILNFFEDVYPRISTLQTVECSECGTPSEKEVPLSWAFFRVDF